MFKSSNFNLSHALQQYTLSIRAKPLLNQDLANIAHRSFRANMNAKPQGECYSFPNSNVRDNAGSLKVRRITDLYKAVSQRMIYPNG